LLPPKKVKTEIFEAAGLETNVPKYIRKQERSAAVLAAIAAFTDTFGFLNFKTHVSFMSGNTTQTGFSAGHGNFAATLLVLLALFSFVSGIFFGTFFSGFSFYKSKVMPFAVVSLLLLVYVFSEPVCNNIYFPIVLLGFAMGYLNTAVNAVGKQAVNTDFVTGTLNNLARHLAFWANNTTNTDALGQWDTHKRRALQLLILWCSFLSGAFLSAVSLSYLKTNALLIPVVALFALSFASGHSNSPDTNNLKN